MTASLPESPINILLVGGGGREHALAARLRASPHCGTLFTTNPENPGIAALATPCSAPVTAKEAYRAVQFCEKQDVRLVVIGPEDPLAEGLADKLADTSASPRRFVFGPGRQAAQIEADKAWAKQIMRAGAIPTGEARIFSDAASAKSYVESREQAPVIKAAGLAKGKGVFVPATVAEAVGAIDEIMIARAFGDAGRQIVVEERLSGPEVSVLAICDGRNILVLPPCQDHKRLRDNDEGPNTGGMGAYCPATLLDDAMMQRIEREILVPTIDTLRRDGIEYRGVLYAGIMLTYAGPKVLEFNCRFGDPETQPLMARLESDLVELLWAACTGSLDQIEVRWKPGAACCVVLASDGYPDKPRTGLPISGIPEAEAIAGVTVYQAGVQRGADGQLLTAGGRVLGVTAVGGDLTAARERAYRACDAIHFERKVFRTDIGARATAAIPRAPRK
jgi:phosphoribosylamine--glycine ligase